MKLLIIVGCLLLNISCLRLKNANEIIVKEIRPTVCKVDSILKINPSVILPVRMIIVDTFLVVYQNRKDSIFGIFSLPYCNHIASRGTIGNGPGEFNMVSLNEFKGIRDSSKREGFSLLSRGNKLQFFHISSIISGDLKPYKTVSLPPGLSRLRAADLRNDSVMLAAPYGGDSNLYYYDLKAIKAHGYLPYPNVYPQLDRNQLRELYGSYITIKPDNSSLAMTYSNEGIIQIIDIASKKTITLRYHGFPTLERNISLSGPSEDVHIHSGYEKIFSWCITSTNNYIYVQVYNQAYNKVFKEGGVNDSFIPEIHIYQWSGKQIARLLPEKLYSEYIIDDNDRYLYTLDINTEGEICRYDLSSYLINQ